MITNDRVNDGDKFPYGKFGLGWPHFYATFLCYSHFKIKAKEFFL